MENSASSALTDIHHQGQSSQKDVQNGDLGKEEAPSPSVVHTGVQTEIVELCHAVIAASPQQARDFDLTETNVRTWVSYNR